MPTVQRVLERRPVADLRSYEALGGGRGLQVARQRDRGAVIAEVEAAGLRGRGGAGFPTALKWRTIAQQHTRHPTAVVVNAAEGEPATFKDHELLRINPYKVLEGALIGARAVGAQRLFIAVKASFDQETGRVRQALEELTGAGWLEGLTVRVVRGPSAYLFGEETGLLEVIEGRQPFPRVTPPYRRGIDPDPSEVRNTAAPVDLTDPHGTSVLINNAETFANVPGILAEGADWYRSLGTPSSPGTLIVTMVGRCRRHGVGEVAMGTPLDEAIDTIGGGAALGHRVVGALSGVANPIVPEGLLHTPLAYEEMAAIGSGLGAGGFYVLDETTDPTAVAYGVARFLSVESCGQCEPCKRDGLVIAELLGELAASTAPHDVMERIEGRLETVADGARCFLATQQQRVVDSVLRLFPDALEAHLEDTRPPSPAEPILPVVDIVDGRAVLDTSQLTKQPDWSHDATYGGRWPAAIVADQPVVIDRTSVAESSTDPVSALAGPPGPSPDPLRPLLDLHRHLRRAAGRLESADAESWPQALEALRADLALYADVTRRVVHPLAERVGQGPADDAVWEAEHEQDAAGALLAHVEGADVKDGNDTLRAVRLLRISLDRQEAELLGLLRRRLDDQQLVDLGDSIREALATTPGGDHLQRAARPMTSRVGRYS